MVEKQLARALVDLALFMEMSGDDVVDPDAAVSALEQLAYNLQLTSIEVRRELAAHFASLAPEYPRHEEFVRGLPETLGLGL